jgi:uncharacterized LabA/DUF88 family protein
MTQRVALLIDGTAAGVSAGRKGMELDYAMLLKRAAQGGRGGNGFERHVVVAQVYIGPAANPTRARGSFVDYVARVGYQVRECREDGHGLKSAVDQDILHDMLVFTLTGRVDVIVLVGGDGGFMRGIRTALAHGVQVEVWGIADFTAEAIRQETQFVDLTNTPLLRAAG